MSFQNASLINIVKKQYLFKLKAYIGAFSALIMVQILALLFSIGGAGMMGSGMGGISLSIEFYSADLVIIFTMIWALIISITITTKTYRDTDFTFVTNRLSRNLANMAFLLTVGSFGGVTAMLTGTLLKTVAFYILGGESVAIQYVSLQHLFIGILVTILYVILLSAIGYFLGTLGQLSKAFIVLIPALFLGSMFVKVDPWSGETVMISIFQFFGGEASLLLFSSKVLLTVSVLFIGSILLSNRMEVRK